MDLNQPDHPSVVVHTKLTGHTDWGPSFIAAMPFQCTEWGNADGAVSLEHVTTGELTPQMAARQHVLYQPKSLRVQSDTEPPIELQTKAHPSTRAVTILGSEDLDVSEIDQTSLRVAGLPPLSVSMRDVDGDGRPDLVVKFDMSKLPLARAGNVRVIGWLKNSQVFAGDATAISQKSR